MAVRRHARDAVELGEPGPDASHAGGWDALGDSGPRGYGRVTEVQPHTIELDDQPVFFLRAGDDDVPVLYLHGVPTSADDWLPFLREGGGIAVDLPGFGRTGKRGDGDFTVDGWARWLPAVPRRDRRRPGAALRARLGRRGAALGGAPAGARRARRAC